LCEPLKGFKLWYIRRHMSCWCFSQHTW
jgi:hypothetical protein